jgi:hypothetical protein
MEFLIPTSSSKIGTDIGDNIPYSLMLDSGLSQGMSRTVGTPTNSTVWTLAFTHKTGKMGLTGKFLNDATFAQAIYKTTNDVARADGLGSVLSTRAIRSPDGWDFYVFANNGTTITGSANGAQFMSGAASLTTLNAAGLIKLFDGLDGYVANVIFVDGQALAPSNFGRISADTQQWVNKTYTGTYGANGFKLEFLNGASLGEDTSGNGNNWTTNGGITSANQYTDTPTNNFCVLSPLDSVAGKLSKGNLRYSDSAANNDRSCSTFAFDIATDNVWWEVTQATGAATHIGVIPVDKTGLTSGLTDALTYYGVSGNKFNSGVASAYGATFTTNDRIGIHCAAGNIAFYKQTGGVGAFVSQGVAFSGLTGKYKTFHASAGTTTSDYNFGQRSFGNTSLPTGAKALCTANLPTPAIPDPTKHIYVVTVAKSGNTNFTLPWSATDYDTRFKIKIRNTTGSHAWIDGLRGYDKVLFSDTTAAEITNANYITVSGTTITLGSALPDGSYVIEAMKAGLVSARQTNTNGTITSTVSANKLAGFSIVTYTGTGANATVGHGLLKAPERIDHKGRSVAASSWFVYSASITAANYLILNSTAAQAAEGGVLWQGLSPTSSLSYLGPSVGTNQAAGHYVAYCHHSVEGYSKFFGSTRNASIDGTFDNCGIKPISITTKAYTTTGNWVVIDDKRDAYNVCSNQLYLNAATAETVATTLDVTATGTKYRTASDPNTAQSYINCIYGYPTKFATAR